MADKSTSDRLDRLDRHALVMTIWTPFGFVAAALLHKGLSAGLTGGLADEGGTGSGWWIAAGFGAILCAFVGHVIANAVTGTRFSQGEVALGGVVYGVGVIALLFAVLYLPAAAVATIVLPAGLGLATLLAAVIVYMVIHFGARPAFARFDVIRDNNLRAASRLVHKGGRR